jgi:hypothetical protein
LERPQAHQKYVPGSSSSSQGAFSAMTGSSIRVFSVVIRVT